MATPATGISEDTLLALARRVVDLPSDQPLTSRVVRILRESQLALTEEHVRRVCEMVYRNAFDQQWYALASSPTRLVSFDPPEATQAARALGAPPVSSGVKMTEPRRAVGSISKQADAPRAGPSYETLYLAEQELRDQVLAARAAAVTATERLMKIAEDTCRQGYSIQEVLDVCLQAPCSEAAATPLLHAVATRLYAAGWEEGKVASVSLPVNPRHPLPAAFATAASMIEPLEVAERALQSVGSWRREAVCL